MHRKRVLCLQNFSRPETSTSARQYTEALKYYQQALEIDRRIGDVANEAKALNNIGILYYNLGRYTESLKYYQQALEISRKIGDVVGEAKAFMNIGIVYSSLGQYSEALRYLQQSLAISRKIGEVAGEAADLTNIGLVYRNLGQYTEALKYHQQALEIARKIGYVAGEAADLTSLGLVYYSLSQNTEALKYYQQALEIDRKIGDVANEAKAINNIGILYCSLGQNTEALKYYQQSLAISRKISYVAGEASVLTNMGFVYHSLGQYSKAVEPFRESITISERLGDLEAIWRGYSGLGKTLWKSGQAEEAVTPYEKAVEAINRLYEFTQGLKEEERSSMIGEKAFVYQEFIELLLELHRKSPDKGYDKQAFIVSEKAKSRTFQELMAKAGARIVLAGDENFKKMIEKEQRLIAEVNNYRTLLTKELSKPENQRNEEVVTSVKEQVSNAERSLGEIEKEIETAYPRYADLKRPKALTVEDLQAMLTTGEIIISYAVGKEKSVAFIIGKESFKLIGLSMGKELLAGLVKNFRKGLDDIYELKDLERYKPEAAHELYQKIFEPLVPDLKDVKKLFISGDDVLYTLPFEALIDGYDSQKFREARKNSRRGEGPYLAEYGSLHYLVDTYAITYLPSASVLRSLRKYQKPGYGKWHKPLIAFADPVFSTEEAKPGNGNKKDKEIEQRGVSKDTELAIQILTRSTGGTELKRLKESAEEANAIAGEVKGKKGDIYTREKATEENVYTANLKDARYILFSTHGLLGGDFSGVAEPALALTLINNPPGRDGFLTMSKVLGLDLNAEIVILSACNTSGKGDKAGSGEGFAGLTRSFMYAGTKSMLVTHWSVESQAARDLMIESISDMKKEAKPDALRDAKLKMKSSTRQMGREKLSLSHPFFWTPFVLVGEGD